MPDGKPNVGGMVNDPDFQKLAPADKRSALFKLTGDKSFSALSDADTMQFVSRMSTPAPSAAPFPGGPVPGAPAGGPPQMPQAPLPAGLQAKPKLSGGFDPISGASLEQVQAQNAKNPPGNILSVIGGGVGGAVGGPPGAALGGVIGSALNPETYKGDKSSYLQNPAARMLTAGATQGALEGAGNLVSRAGAALMPNALKKGMSNLLKGPMDEAGQQLTDTCSSRTSMPKGPITLLL